MKNILGSPTVPEPALTLPFAISTPLHLCNPPLYLRITFDQVQSHGYSTVNVVNATINK